MADAATSERRHGRGSDGIVFHFRSIPLCGFLLDWHKRRHPILLAVDRNNPNAARLYNHVDPSVIRALHGAIREAHRRGKPASVCGEMAADPGSAILLLGMGLVALSMSASAGLRIKWMIRSLLRQRAKEVLYQAMRMQCADAVRTMLDGEPDRAGLGELVLA
jgi:phosphotransferase system, enzyme I, PtsP